eukprot:2502532-Pleurochrysis_carterae.AAC.1
MTCVRRAAVMRALRAEELGQVRSACALRQHERDRAQTAARKRHRTSFVRLDHEEEHERETDPIFAPAVRREVLSWRDEQIRH